MCPTSRWPNRRLRIRLERQGRERKCWRRKGRTGRRLMRSWRLRRLKRTGPRRPSEPPRSGVGDLEMETGELWRLGVGGRVTLTPLRQQPHKVPGRLGMEMLGRLRMDMLKGKLRTGMLKRTLKTDTTKKRIESRA
ncbi:hypothetical protein Dsin_026352 [Dipteronia sinensis]|uniref:Uncharacterized protein n=1 Tax=Dipteronia sinensis TaxID=43782 RepID=A0AAD9ZY23_9ROSI|nr:hypothetical protein Dsin_026352 [Dipteronia sinensis]